MYMRAAGLLEKVVGTEPRSTMRPCGERATFVIYRRGVNMKFEKSIDCVCGVYVSSLLKKCTSLPAECVNNATEKRFKGQLETE